MGVEDDRAFLKAKIDDRNMKCCNCNSWHPIAGYPGRGACAHTGPTPSADVNVFFRSVTQDLSVCSEWIRKA